MIQTGDYVNIKFQDEIRAKKPIGIYWLQAFSAKIFGQEDIGSYRICLLYTSPSPRDVEESRMPSSA